MGCGGRTFIGREETIVPGTLVYEGYYPQNPGIVRKVLSDKTVKETAWYSYRRVEVEVEWLKKTKKRAKITVCCARNLQDYEALIEEHRRKAKSQSAVADELREM